MDTFLASIRPRLDSEEDSQVIIVTGNESADLDSIVSALTTSFFLTNSHSYPGTIILPFINIPKIDLALRSDVEFVLETNHINHDLLFFRDDLPILENLVTKNRLSLFLVDHNVVMGSMASLSRAKVVGVLDHHVDEGLYNDTANPRRIEMVGSCSSLVADQFLKSQMERDQELNGGEQPNWVQQVTRLLLGPILIDTQDLKPERKKVKPLDLAMAKLIFPYTGWESMEDLFRRIENARRDTSRLSFYDLLRKDYKEWTVQHQISKKDVKVGISSVIGLMDKYATRDTKEVLQKAIQLWAVNRSLDVSMVLLADDLGEGHGGYQRQLIVNPVTEKVHGITEQIEGVAQLQLERTTIIDTEDSVNRGERAYLQHNSTCTRKQIWPYVEKLLTESPQPSNL
ncbi:Exopolyphosphatase [Linnemannia elongata]|uniref:DHH phosphoesterase n=1 Tax=Linnemannia elongata AG-77 TaxID=1314771 RepID=A0A197K3L8_9FUNG|nr:Exopolyphosphatase [Linnemannia elongata]OAQ32080.1 DHH phosphoesterase [Linnemannia elongata AG-77]